MNVRPPERHEFQAMAEKGRDFWEASPYKSIPYNVPSMCRSFAEMTEAGLMLIAEEGGQIFGGIGGVMGPAYFNDKYLLGSERFWWLDPTRRASRVGLQLINGFKRAAQQAGCHFLHMMALESSDPERAEFIYRRLGFEPSERMYVARLSWD